jgi:hypothetical protein
MAVRCVIALDYGSESEARSVQGALAPDDVGFVASRVEGVRVVAEMEAATPMKLLHTLEDYLACVGVAERAVRAAKG